jgi:hypothetical protein
MSPSIGLPPPDPETCLVTLSPPATEGPILDGITGTQEPTRWHGGGARRRQHRDARE